MTCSFKNWVSASGLIQKISQHYFLNSFRSFVSVCADDIHCKTCKRLLRRNVQAWYQYHPIHHLFRILWLVLLCRTVTSWNLQQNLIFLAEPLYMNIHSNVYPIHGTSNRKLLGWYLSLCSFVLDSFFPTRIACWLCIIHHFIAFNFLYQTFLEFSDLN
jgi:hypothetical protein